MSKLVANVFKIIIIAVLIGVFATLFACVFDVFTAIDRIDSVARYVSYDMARNNSLQYNVYTYLDGELRDISARSSYLKVYDRLDCTPEKWGGHNNALGVTVAVFDSEAGDNPRYVQSTSKKVGTLYIKDNPATLVKSGETGRYQVANYGETMCLKIQAQVRPTSWIMQGTLADSGWFTWAKFDLVLKYQVPALEYIKG